MKQFTPCQGKITCRDDGSRCLTCGRSFDEITRLREALDQLAALAVDYEYANTTEYGDYVARKLDKMIAHRRREATNAP